jgi:hypothetical protein
MSSEPVSSLAADAKDATGRAAASVRVGIFAPFDLPDLGPETVRAFLAQAWPPPLATATEGKNRRWAWWSWAA